jgi:hypothetical protein
MTTDQTAQIRLTRVLRSLHDREAEVENLRERVYRLAQQLQDAEAILLELNRPSNPKIMRYFQYAGQN